MMPSLFWLALLLGYLAGVAAAVALLPMRLIEPLAGPLALTTVVAVAVFGVLFRLRQTRRRRLAEIAPPPAPTAGALHAALEAEAAVPPTPAPEPEAAAAVAAQDSQGHADGRWPLLVRLEPPGVLGPRELQEILAEGRVDVRLRPIASVEQPAAALYHALPRLSAADDSHLAPASYRSTAARCGLLGLIDQQLLRRCAEMLRAAYAEGREVLIACEIAAESLSDPDFGAELEQQLERHPELTESLVLALDHVVRERPIATALADLRARGLRFCLRRIGPPPVAAAELGASGFDFILLEAARFALDAPAGEVDPALRELQRAFGPAGPMLLIGRVGLDQSTIALPGDWALSADDGAFDLARPRAA